MLRREMELRMRSLRYVVVFLLIVILFGTVYYFGEQSRKLVTNKDKTKEEPMREAMTKEEEEEQEKEEGKEMQEEAGEKGPTEELEETAIATETPPSKKEEEVKVGGFYGKGHRMKSIEGALYLKTFLKDMDCRMGDDYSMACCGKLSFSPTIKDEENLRVSEEHEGCILLNVSKLQGDNDFTYRFRFVFESQLLAYSEVRGFPKPDSKCYAVTEGVLAGQELCASVNYLATDETIRDGSGYQSCLLMEFGWDSDERRMAGQLDAVKESLSCDTAREAITSKVAATYFSLVLSVKLQPAAVPEIDQQKPKANENQGVKVVDKKIDSEDLSDHLIEISKEKSKPAKTENAADKGTEKKEVVEKPAEEAGNSSQVNSKPVQDVKENKGDEETEKKKDEVKKPAEVSTVNSSQENPQPVEDAKKNAGGTEPQKSEEAKSAEVIVMDSSTVNTVQPPEVGSPATSADSSETNEHQEPSSTSEIKPIEKPNVLQKVLNYIADQLMLLFYNLGFVD